MRLRINAYHQRLLSGVSFSRITDATALQNVIDKDLKELEAEIFAPSSTFATEAKVQFLLEKAQIHIMQGLDIKAKEDVKSANQQPQLTPLDQITLLTEATIKDTFLPLDKLNSEEVLPYAIRVLNDKPTNWQIYTQALLVRSRIESHRSRTQERSVLQLQVIVDQIIADTTEEPSPSADGVPEIRVTSFLPRAKASESAPITERLQYIFQLNTPTRWEIETELAFAWSSAGSLVSALEIFKRLKLWPEVALCHHSVGQEDKARQIVRRQLYYSEKGPDMDVYDVDAEAIATEKWEGEIRSPPPPHSPRLWCILGDLDNDPTCWQRAWEISHHRYARAQRTLGEYYARKGDLALAREAYMAATVVNRQNNATWSRLGDIDLAVGNWDGAIIAFQQSIMIDDSDAKTYSNLGSALLSKHAELTTLTKIGEAAPAEGTSPADILPARVPGDPARAA
ncbi:putative TPR repeat-containing protein C19B12.01 [Glarea lozoyensis 74030]|uniref:Putative TPR repeat-containing protein C19B12.01 n=1 Tax=Glarea lozoyensis (strain ATCC 74030 / MF5533) TaxID=1104152 RepID=H0EP96_GLAL7|nr:putative TPR repeat-containing protein C19B12.01 [Glarea lozoyensis 74030]